MRAISFCRVGGEADLQGKNRAFFFLPLALFVSFSTGVHEILTQPCRGITRSVRVYVHFGDCVCFELRKKKNGVRL